jgi:type I restriction enzyme M protein
MNNESATFDFINMFRGCIIADSYVSAALLVAETKEEFDSRQMADMSEERLYETMLSVADRLCIGNPFSDKTYFIRTYRAYGELSDGLDWEAIMAESMRNNRYLTVSSALYSEYHKHFEIDTGAVLIAECEKFVPNLKRLVDVHPGCSFTLTVEHDNNVRVLNRIFFGYKNVEIVNSSIYKYGFTNNRYDLILSVPNFGMRNLADDDNFMSRDQDAAALENLLLHTNSGGELIITMPARITYAQGKNGELRRFVQQSYRVKEIAELPEGTFEGTGIKTYLIDIVNAQPGDDDVIIRRYVAPKRKNRRDVAKELIIENETFVVSTELDELGDWNINKIFSQQDEEWLKFQQSSVRRVAMGGVAEVFRGKSVTKKDMTGAIGVVNISNIGEYDIDYDRLDHLNEEERKVTSYLLKDGDVLIPARGTAIRTAVFHEQKYPCIASANVIVIRPDRKTLDSTYLKVFLDSPLGKKLVSGTQQGISIINISYKDLTGLEIPIPSMDEQKKTTAEYTEELKKYQDTIKNAEMRWKDVLCRLQSF